MKKNIKLGSYICEKEPNYLKVSHENRSWNFRLGATPENIEKFFTDCKEDDWRTYFEVAFDGTQTFSILAIQNPMYMEAWIAWHNSYFAGLNKKVSTEENEVIIAEEQALYEMKEQAETETNKTAEE